MRRLRTIWLLLAILVGLPEVAKCAITLNQVDTFQGSLDAWTDGVNGGGGNNLANIGTGGPNGAGDGYLQISSGSFGGEPKLITFNQIQWIGNYTTAGVGSISMELKNFGTSTLPIRIVIRDATGGQTIPGYSSTTPFMLAADGQWHLAQFSLTAATMTAVGTGLPSFATELTNVHDFRLLSSTAPAIIGDTISARIGVDDITALPPPPTAWSGATSTNWSDTGNWTGAVPGAVTGTTNTSTATFNRAATNPPLTIDAGRNLQNLTFDTASVVSPTLGTVAGQSLLLTAAGTTQTTSTVINPQTINAPLVLEGNYAFTSGATSSSATLTFGGGITPGPTTGVTTLTLSGANTGTNTIKGVLANHGTGLLAVSKSGAGEWILSGANTYSGGTTVSSGTLEFDTAPTIANSTSFLINGGTLRFKITTGTATVGTGVTATVASGATLELAGSVSALAAGANRVNISNSNTTAGILVSGTNQVVGKITGGGAIQVNAGDSLTANSIIQGALNIGGTASSHGTLTIAASDASGNSLIDPLDATAGDPSSALATFLISSDLGGGPQIADSGSASSASISGNRAGESSGFIGDSAGGNNLATVPEPSTLILLAVGGLALVVTSRKRLRSTVRWT